MTLNGEGNGNPLQYSCLENAVDRGAWWAAVHGVSQGQTWLMQLSMHACIGEGNGNPLQCSCPENPWDAGAWWAAVHGVAQSRTRLKRLSSSRKVMCHITGVHCLVTMTQNLTTETSADLLFLRVLWISWTILLWVLFESTHAVDWTWRAGLSLCELSFLTSSRHYGLRAASKTEAEIVRLLRLCLGSCLLSQ